MSFFGAGILIKSLSSLTVILMGVLNNEKAPPLSAAGLLKQA